MRTALWVGIGWLASVGFAEAAAPTEAECEQAYAQIVKYEAGTDAGKRTLLKGQTSAFVKMCVERGLNEVSCLLKVKDQAAYEACKPAQKGQPRASKEDCDKAFLKVVEFESGGDPVKKKVVEGEAKAFGAACVNRIPKREVFCLISAADKAAFLQCKGEAEAPAVDPHAGHNHGSVAPASEGPKASRADCLKAAAKIVQFEGGSDPKKVAELEARTPGFVDICMTKAPKYEIDCLVSSPTKKVYKACSMAAQRALNSRK